MPKLITKLPEGKDPVICICFEKEFDAEKTNKELVEKFGKDIYQIRFMPVNGTNMNIMLISDNNQKLYKNVTYDYDKLTWWIEYTKERRMFAFCHITMRGDGHKLVRIIEGAKPFVLKVNSYSVVNEDRLDGF